jgi:phospholipase/lecithinase/hemolysin
MAGLTITVPSKSGGNDHHVRIVTAKVDGPAGPAGTTYLTCDCKGGRYAWASKTHPGRGCHAMVEVRVRAAELLGKSATDAETAALFPALSAKQYGSSSYLA